jgi:hypothetical protein
MEGENVARETTEQSGTPAVIPDPDVALICLSSKSVDEEGHVRNEIQSALGMTGKPSEGTILACLEDCQIPDRFLGLPSVKLFEPGGYERLLDLLQKRAQELERFPPSKKDFFSILIDVSQKLAFRKAPSPITGGSNPTGPRIALKELFQRNSGWLWKALEIVGGVSSIIAVLVFLTGKENIRQYLPIAPTPIAPQGSTPTEPVALMPTHTLTMSPTRETTQTVTVTPPLLVPTTTGTLTPTPRRGYTMVDKEEVFSLSPRVKAFGELAKEKYTPEERNQVDRKLVFTIHATPDVPMFWRWYWCAATEKILEQNLGEMDVIFEADGRVISADQLATVTYSYKNQDGDTWWCFTYSTVLRDWKPGTYRFLQTTVIKSAIHDGKDIFPAGLKIYDYTVTIAP